MSNKTKIETVTATAAETIVTQQQALADTEQPQPVRTLVSPDSDLAEMTQYWISRRSELERHVAEIEKFIGFVGESEALAVRVAKIEAFLGIKG